MSNIELRRDCGAATLRGATAGRRFEVVVVPVSDVDRARRFYGHLGWSPDLDYMVGDECRVIQFTARGSGCLVILGKDVATATPGSMQRLLVVVSDIETARDELIRRDIEIGELFDDAGGGFHPVGGERLVSGPNPRRASYAAFNGI